MLEGARAWSLQRRLTLIAASAMALALAFGGLAMYWTQSVELHQAVDARLDQLGSTVLSLVEDGPVGRSGEAVFGSHHLEMRPAAALLYRLQVWSHDGVLLLRSHEAPSDRPLMDLNHRGFETVLIDDEEYRTLSLPTKDGGVVQVSECLDEALMRMGMITAYYVGFLVLPFGLVSGVSWLLMRRSLRSIDSLDSELRRRNPLDVTPLNIDNPPQELLPVLNALDLLFSRVGRAISVERRFTSVAAHEMRTPLAGLRAQAQIANSAATEVESRHALRSIMQGVDRASHILDQLLDLARIDGLSKDHDLPFQTVRLTKVFRNVMYDLESTARLKRVSVSARFEADEVHGLEFGLYLAVRNLLANAILYCPEGGRVDIESLLQGTDVVLTVDDSGDGIPPQERDRAFERFNRLGQIQTDGVGLGLSIVLLVVELHGARIQLFEAPIGGLRAQLSFPQPDAQAVSAGNLTHAPA